ncbi:putative crossover junction endonuclease EME2 isoform X7 [Saimiri boliviensis]|uniref:Structure-specific endonuclease subunit EME2 n=1 Tax=Saimiri boliviensis boliviensis TaxID=39432 RepID=A0A2K6UHZ0_SAIBB|nr:probable crossover junction endonuclease EME2 isoform X7 [Saimiri boliviensis boliviensis]
MARVGPGRARASRRGRSGQRRPATWDISDSDTEGPAHSEAAAKAGDPAGARRAAAEALRLMRPEQVLRRLAVRVDPAFLEDAGADVLMEALEALGCECLIEPQRPARSLQWTRASPDPCPGTLPPEVWAAGEQELLLLLEPEEFLQGVATLTQLSGPTRWVPWITPEITARPHLAVIGLDAYLWSRQHVPRGTQPESPQVAGAKVAVDWPEVEEALVLLQLWANLDVLLVASWEELSQHVCAITKALAQCPLKQYRESQAFSFCTAGRWAAGEPVTRDGTGLRGAWWRQIRQFSRVSPAVADAVVTAFPSPRLLQQALVACSTERERLGLLADLPVTASEDGRPRRVGPDLSRRICLFLTTANPDLLLDLSS